MGAFHRRRPRDRAPRTWVERGQPALDAGCGSERLLVPWLRAALDVDGTIVVCGVFGIATTREEDQEALRRLHAALEPGRMLAADPLDQSAADARRRLPRLRRAPLIEFLPLEDADLPLLREWLEREHVRRWWREPIEEELAHDRTGQYLIVVDGRPVAMIQSYDGEVDLLIGEEELIGRGLGPRVLTRFVDEDGVPHRLMRLDRR